MAFSTTDGALAGFRLVREHPRAVAVWGALTLVVSAVSNVVMVLAGAGDLPHLSWPPSEAEIEQVSRQMQALAPVSLFCMLFNLVAFAIVFTGVSRVLLRPHDRGFAHLRLGRDEFRQVLAMLVCALVMLGAYVAAILVGGLIVSLVSGIAGGNGALSVFALVLVVMGIFAFMVYTAVRISFLGVLAFVTGKIDLKGALALTKGRFWPLFGAYFLAFILFIVVNITVMVLGAALGIMLGGFSGASQVLQSDVSSVSAMLTPTGIVSLLVISAMSILKILVLLAPVPEIYRQISGTPPEVAQD